MSHVPKYRSTGHALLTIGRTEGFKTLYAGLTPNLTGSTVSWGCYFYAYNYLRGRVREMPGYTDSKGQLGPGVNMACATLSGFCTCIATNPIWLVKTRLQLQTPGTPSLCPLTTCPLPSNQNSSHTCTDSGARMNGMLDAFRTVIKHEGIAGLYQGLFPSLLLVSHGALQFMAYEEIKKGFQVYVNGGDEHCSTWQTFLTGSLAKVFASVVTYPTQVVLLPAPHRSPAPHRQCSGS